MPILAINWIIESLSADLNRRVSKRGVEIENLTKDWKDGEALCALVDYNVKGIYDLYQGELLSIHPSNSSLLINSLVIARLTIYHTRKHFLVLEQHDILTRGYMNDTTVSVNDNIFPDSDPVQKVAQSMIAAYKFLGIPQLIEPEDFISNLIGTFPLIQKSRVELQFPECHSLSYVTFRKIPKPCWPKASWIRNFYL